MPKIKLSEKGCPKPKGESSLMDTSSDTKRRYTFTLLILLTLSLTLIMTAGYTNCCKH